MSQLFLSASNPRFQLGGNYFDYTGVYIIPLSHRPHCSPPSKGASVTLCFQRIVYVIIQVALIHA